MSFINPSGALIATCGGDTVKLFDVTLGSGDPCVLSYSPSPGSHVNSIKWNHTNLVLASAGDDKKISLWHKNGQCLGTIPVSSSDSSDGIQESIVSISFSNKGSRYLCSGGSGRMIRIWDLQRKRCIKWLSGHTDTITGVMYNCKDEHLASISLSGDLILHNLASGGRAAELKDPSGQVLRVLDYSWISRHILATAGDDGSIHVWDTAGRGPKVSWLKQHSAPTTGVCFSPSSDKIIASVGLDKKLYISDTGTKRHTFCAPYEAPFSSLAYSDDGNILAAGSNIGTVVFYDVRGKAQPITVLCAYSSSEAISSLCWQRSKPSVVVEKNCTAEAALLGGNIEDSVLMPDPLRSTTTTNFPSDTVVTNSHSLLTSVSSSRSNMPYQSPSDGTPRSHLFPSGLLSKLQAPPMNYGIKDDMDVFSPLADVQPITPSIGNQFDDHNEARTAINKKSALYASSLKRFVDGSTDPHPISDWVSNLTSKQEDFSNTLPLTAAPGASKSESSSSSTPPEAWGGNALTNKLSNRHPTPAVSHFTPSLTLVSNGSVFRGLQDSSSSASHSKNSTYPLSNSLSLPSTTALKNEVSSFTEPSTIYHPSYVSTSMGNKLLASPLNAELPALVPSILPRRYSSYAERISTTSAFNGGTFSTMDSPKSKQATVETRDELTSYRMSRQEPSATARTGNLSIINEVASQPHQSLGGVDQQQGTSSFSLQLVQRTLEETLGSVHRSIHEDVRNLHIDLLRQFHMQEMEMSSLMTPVLEKLDDLMKEVQLLRRENHQLRQLL
ncbi:hypothetical protein J5N97_006180 [Dioscorea zingiberensis]|uniref:Protein NEDD1 n=1 Tax=Dioscorea zingiberensis TaxID=325984 RepID=A0A9D5DAG0_9LILI|nr:hypothetical protein J5N97_006180 [Dioscorea zingiberensis]